MDESTFDRAPHIAPLLVKLHDSYCRYGHSKEGRSLMKEELTETITDLLKAEIGSEEQNVLAEVLVVLIRQAEVELKQAVAERLSTVEGVPLKVILHLADQEIPVASPVLRHSSVLSDQDLIYIVKGKGPEYWQAIAAREALSEDLINVLADTRDVGTAVALSKNDRIILTTHAMSIMAGLAAENATLARPLVMRSELPAGLAQKLYAHVGAELQSYMKAAFDIEETALAAAEDVVSEFAAPAILTSEFMPSIRMVAAADRYAESGRLDMDLIMETLQRGQIASFIAQFARYSGMPAETIHELLTQARPKGFAVLCRALHVPKPEFSRIFLLTSRMRSADRIVNQEDMLATLTCYEKVSQEKAQEIVDGGFRAT